MNTEFLINQLSKDFPACFGRSEISSLTGGLIAGGTLANLAVAGEGPPFLRLGKKTVYEKETFLKWLESRMKEESSEEVEHV